MKQTVRHGLGIALSAMAFLCNYSPWVREAASLPDALTLTSGQKFVVQTGLPMLAASDGGAVSVLASQDERVTISAEAGGQTITVDAQAEPDPPDGRRNLGVWVRDSTAGVGTLTYIDPANQAYGALGHAIVDADTGRLLAAREGAILHASIVGVTKGQSGKAG